MKKSQRELKSSYRSLWKTMVKMDRTRSSYPTWLEGELEYYQNLHRKVCDFNSEKEGRFDAYCQYVRDLEMGLEVLERTVRSIRDAKDRGAVFSSIKWVRRLIHDAKERFEKGV